MRACDDIEHEIFIVDNASEDRSVAMLKSEFPQIKLIENKKNEGYSRANNRALKMARGEYVLLIDPDTITKRDTIHKAVEFMDKHAIAGGLGVRMVDAQGSYLPESKRGLTSPWSAFFRLTGLSKMLSKSRLFDRNQKSGTEDEFETAEVDILGSAFMLMRRSVLNKVGFLDERFFLYGADIDLSYRIRQAGFKNYYFPKTYIIHFKEQSIRKYSMQYLKNYYGAMFIFAGKYMFKLPGLQLKGIGQQRQYPAIYEVER